MYKIGYFSTSQLVTFRKNNSNKIIYKINLFNDYQNYLGKKSHFFYFSLLNIL